MTMRHRFDEELEWLKREKEMLMTSVSKEREDWMFKEIETLKS